MEPVEETSNVNLGLKILFAILLLVLVGEIAFGVMNSRKKNSKTSVATPTNIISSTKVEVTDKESATRITNIQGKIIGFKNINGILFPENYKPELFIYLSIKKEDRKKGTARLFAVDKNDLRNMSVTDNTGNIISYKDLEVGQNIKIIENYDLKKKVYTKFEIVVEK